MSKNSFTPEELQLLKQNPFTAEVIPYRLTFTTEFKEFFIREYYEGVLPGQILGDRRIRDISHAYSRTVQKARRVLKPASAGTENRSLQISLTK